jgi:hypothetical protein
LMELLYQIFIVWSECLYPIPNGTPSQKRLLSL